MRPCPTHKCLPQRKYLRVQLNRRMQAYLAVFGERSTARQCRGYGPCPSRSAAGHICVYTYYIYTYICIHTQGGSAPSCWKTKFCRTNFYAAVEMAPLSMRMFRVIMPITQGLPQRNESFEYNQTDGRRWYGPCAVQGLQPKVHLSMSTRWPGNQCGASAEI